MLVVTKTDFKTKFNGVNDINLAIDSKGKKIKKKNYRKHIVNKWHVIAFLLKNPILIMERKHNLKVIKKEEKKKSSCFCCRKKNQSSA
jgi:hypothetical protein